MSTVPASPPDQLADAGGELPEEIASYCDKITITFERRSDGGLRVYSDELPGLALSHADHAAVLADLKPAIEGLVLSRLTAAEAQRDAAIRGRDEALREHTDMMWQRRRADERADAALARAERAEKALEDLKGSFHEDSDAYAKITAALPIPPQPRS